MEFIEMKDMLLQLGWHIFNIYKKDIMDLDTHNIVSEIKSEISLKGIKTLGFMTIITFDGFAEDDGEVYENPKVRTFWAKLKKDLPELPILLGEANFIDHSGVLQDILMCSDIIDTTKEGGDVMSKITNVRSVLDDNLKNITISAINYSFTNDELDMIKIEYMSRFKNALGDPIGDKQE